MSDRYRIDVRRWRSALRDAVELPIATRGVLYVLGQWMNSDGSNAYPRRHRLAASCQLSESSVDRHLGKAVAAGYLHRTSGGHKGHVATYAATIPAYRWDDDTAKLVQPLPVQIPQRAAPVTRNGAIAPHSRPHSASLVQSKGRTSDAPTSYCTSDKHLAASFDAGSPQAASATKTDEHEDEEQLRGDEEAQSWADHEWISDQVGGLYDVEESAVDGMLSRGAHRQAIVNAIRSQRADVTS